MPVKEVGWFVFKLLLVYNNTLSSINRTTYALNGSESESCTRGPLKALSVAKHSRTRLNLHVP